MTKWDTIQADVADAYAYLDEENEIQDDEDFFGFANAIEIDHLTDEQIDEVLKMFGDK
jgi:hypothetical protein